MRRSPVLIVSLVVACLILFAIALVQGAAPPPAPVGRTVPIDTRAASVTGLSDLERAGFTLHDGGAGASGERRLSYVFEGPSGFSAVLRDDRPASGVSNRRELAFDIRVSVLQAARPAGAPGFTPSLVDTAQHAVRYDAAVVAGLGYLATEASPRISPAMLQDAVVDHLQRYRRRWPPVQAVCAGCEGGFGDESAGGSDGPAALRNGWPGWTIGVIRNDLDGDAALTVRITASLPSASVKP